MLILYFPYWLSRPPQKQDSPSQGNSSLVPLQFMDGLKNAEIGDQTLTVSERSANFWGVLL
jgi:hypothetical protein